MPPVTFRQCRDSQTGDPACMTIARLYLEGPQSLQYLPLQPGQNKLERKGQKEERWITLAFWHGPDDDVKMDATMVVPEGDFIDKMRQIGSVGSKVEIYGTPQRNSKEIVKLIVFGGKEGLNFVVEHGGKQLVDIIVELANFIGGTKMLYPETYREVNYE